MPLVFLDRLPLPSLKTYTAISVALLSSSLFYAHQSVIQILRSNGTEVLYDNAPGDTEIVSGQISASDLSEIILYISNMFHVMVTEPWCVWTGVNMAYCSLILLGKVVQKVIFGELRVSEQQHIKDKFWNFVFYKFIFIFGILNLEYMDEVVLWCAWFSVLCFLQLLTQLCKDRFEYLSFSPSSGNPSHARLIMLLSSIFFTGIFLLSLSIYISPYVGVNKFAFMAAECVLLLVRSLSVMTRYMIHLYDLRVSGLWETRGTYIYYSELSFDLLSLSIDFLHHFHMLIWSNIFLSMASLVIGMQLRHLFQEVKRRVKKHKNYLSIVKHMEENYPMATASELEAHEDNCAVCWDKMESARKLPCAHLFHNSCLCSWLEQDTTCPTCRKSLSTHRHHLPDTQREEENLEQLEDEGENRGQQRNHFFHFDGSRYFSWFPSVVVEVTHPPALGRAGDRAINIQTSQLDTMARNIQDMFPAIPFSAIQDDLRVTRSLELTVHNILDGNIVIPPTTSNATATTATLSEPSLYRSLSDPHSSALIDYESSSSPSPSWPVDEPSTAGGGGVTSGSRFSKSPTERESILQSRKDELYMKARRNYLKKHPSLSHLAQEAAVSDAENNSTGV